MRVENGEMPADDFLGGVAVDFGGVGAPAGDDAQGVERAHDGVGDGRRA